MKQREKNIVAVDVGSAEIKMLLGSFSDSAKESKPFFELHGSVTKTEGLSKNGTITDRKKFIRSVNEVLNGMVAFSGYEVDEVILSYTHPNMLFFKKTVGLPEIKNKEGIYITEDWLKVQKEKLREKIYTAHKHKRCAYFEVVSLLVDGEEVIYDPYEFTATKSLYMTYIYILAPTAFLGTLLESVEHFVSVQISRPAAVANGVLLSDEQKEQGTVLCDIGAEFTNVTIYKNGVIVGIRVVPFGGNTITNEIALLKKMPPEEAEQIKKSIQTEESSLKKRDLQSINRKIGLLLKKFLLPYIKETDSQKNFPGGIMLIGRGSLYPDIEKIIEKTIGLHVFHAKTPYHIQNQQHTHQSAWHTAYAVLYGIVTRQAYASLYSEKISFLRRITGFIHAIARLFR